MKRTRDWIAVPVLSALCGLAGATTAHAELEQCGDVFLQKNAHCEYKKKEQCMTECKTETVETACVAKLYTVCQNQCTSSASTMCESGCSSGCTTECQTQAMTPEPPDCMGLCVSDCEKTCEAAGPRAGCCKHTCNARCENKCRDMPAPATMPAECTMTCSNACSGSCTAQANVQCQTDCQTVSYPQCETETIQTCETKCMQEGGAIFCDGQFINAENARSCGDEIKAKLDINIDFDAVADAVSNTATDVANTTANAANDVVDTGKSCADDACSVSRVGDDGHGRSAAALVGLCALGLTAFRIRRRRRDDR